MEGGFSVQQGEGLKPALSLRNRLGLVTTFQERAAAVFVCALGRMVVCISGVMRVFRLAPVWLTTRRARSFHVAETPRSLVATTPNQPCPPYSGTKMVTLQFDIRVGSRHFHEKQPVPNPLHRR
jgi:hypothetical protein